jgi:hypothetical protein
VDINELLKTLTSGWGDRLAILVPLAFLGLIALYVAYLVMGYLKASHVGLEAEAVTGEITLPPAAGTDVTVTADGPRCPVDGLRYPRGAVFCLRCEADLVQDCPECGTTVSAADATCFSCGTSLA